MSKLKETDKRLIPEVNIGTAGHVDCGKSTLVEMMSGKWPAVHSEELKRGITIKLGYADATVYFCKSCSAYFNSELCPTCSAQCEPKRTLSFIDAPGHETLMATVLAGACLMDGVLLVIAADEKCPQPQTKEHLLALDIVGIKNIVIVQNKIDVVSEERALESYREIKEFIKGTVAEGAPIIPVCAQKRIGLEQLLAAIEERVPTPKRQLTKPPRMLVVRSFDINKPGAKPNDIKGGVLGGALIAGSLRVGEEIEIKPGVKLKGQWQPLKTSIVGLQKAGKNLDSVGAGGLLGVLTTLDPSLTKADSLSGSVAGSELPPTCNEISIEINLLKSILGSKELIERPRIGEQLMLNIGTARTIGTVKMAKKDRIDIELKIPVCCEAGERSVLSRRIAERWRLIGFGKII